MKKTEWQEKFGLLDEEMERLDLAVVLSQKKAKITDVYDTPEWRKKDPNWTIFLTKKSGVN